MQDTPGPSARQRWEITFLGFCCLFFNAGIGFFLYPVIKQSFQDDFGWSHSDMDLGLAWWCLAGALFSPLCGKAIDRFGPRKVILLGTLLQIGATFSFPYMTQLDHLYVLFVLSAIAGVANTFIPVATAIEQWFDEDRGKAMGLAMTGIGIGGFCSTTLCGYLLESFTWQQAYQIFGVFLVLNFLLLLWRFKDSPAFQFHSSAGPADVPYGLTLMAALKTRSFWAIGLADALIGMVYNIFTAQLPLIGTVAGHSEVQSSMVLGVFLFFQSVGLILFGVLADSKPLKTLMVISYLGPAIATLALFQSTLLFFMLLFAVAAGIVGGGRQALFPLALGNSFGVAHMGAIYGALNVLFYLGMALGPALASGLYEAQQHFNTVYVICIVLGILAGLGIMFMRKEYED